eukprot:12122137-Heterocapsa_arctica.AAC.1
MHLRRAPVGPSARAPGRGRWLATAVSRLVAASWRGASHGLARGEQLLQRLRGEVRDARHQRDHPIAVEAIEHRRLDDAAAPRRPVRAVARRLDVLRPVAHAEARQQDV